MDRFATPQTIAFLVALGAYALWSYRRLREGRARLEDTLPRSESWSITAAIITRTSLEVFSRDPVRWLATQIETALETGDLGAVRALLDELDRATGEKPLADLRAFCLACGGAADEAETILASRSNAEPTAFSQLARAVLAHSRGARAQAAAALAGRASLFVSCAPPVRALAYALERSSGGAGAYRAAPSAGGARAHEAWILRVFSQAIDGVFPAPNHPAPLDAGWNREPSAPPLPAVTRPLRDRVTAPFVLAVGSLLLFHGIGRRLGRELLRAPTLALQLAFAVPLAGIMAALLWGMRQARAQARAAEWLFGAALTPITEREHSIEAFAHGAASPLVYIHFAWLAAGWRLEAGDLRGAARFASEAWEKSFALGSPRDRARVLRTHAVALARLGHAEESESALARMSEDFSSFRHNTAARFEARLALAVASGDRERAAKIASELSDAIDLSYESELLAHAVLAATRAPSLRDEVLARVRAWAPARAILEASAGWVLDALERPPLALGAPTSDPLAFSQPIAADQVTER